MPNFVIENDDTTEESNVASDEQTAETAESQAEETEETVTEQPSDESPDTEESQEPTVEIDGEQVSLSEIKKLREEYKNDSAWKDKNRRESEALNREKKELESLKLLKPVLEQRPDIIKELLQPKQRDIDVEVREHYARRPDPYADPQAFANWEYRKDQLLREQTTAALQKQAETRIAQQEAQRHNDDLFQKGVTSYLKEKTVTDGEFMEMQRWILENVKDQNGKYPMNAFDIAYTALFSDRKVRSEKVNTVKQILKSQEKAKPAVQKGSQKAQESETELSESEQGFVAEMNARKPRRTME